jgi:molecular chaperone GrpE
MAKDHHAHESHPADDFDPSAFEAELPDLGGEGAGDGQSLEEQLQLAWDEAKGNHDKFLRAQAELETYRRRVQKERDEDRRFAALPIVKELLPVLDNLQRAVEAADKADSVVDLKAGVEMVLQQSLDVLKKLQITPIAAVGQPFDPNLHEAVSQMPSAEYPPMTVMLEVERGYTLHERVIRPSKVIVSGPS